MNFKIHGGKFNFVVTVALLTKVLKAVVNRFVLKSVDGKVEFDLSFNDTLVGKICLSNSVLRVGSVKVEFRLAVVVTFVAPRFVMSIKSISGGVTG